MVDNFDVLIAQARIAVAESWHDKPSGERCAACGRELTNREAQARSFAWGNLALDIPEWETRGREGFDRIVCAGRCR